MVPKVVKQMNKKPLLKTLGTSVINNPLSPSFLVLKLKLVITVLLMDIIVLVVIYILLKSLELGCTNCSVSTHAHPVSFILIMNMVIQNNRKHPQFVRKLKMREGSFSFITLDQARLGYIGGLVGLQG